MRILYRIAGGLMVAFGAFMFLGFVVAWMRGNFRYSLGIQVAVLFCGVLMPLLLGLLFLKMSSAQRIDTAPGSHSIITAEDAPPNDDERGQGVIPSRASLADSSSSVRSLGTHMRIRFSLTRFDLFKARTAALMSSRPLQVLLLLVAAFSGFSGFTAESVAGKTVAYRIFFASLQIFLVLGFGFCSATLLNAWQSFTAKAKGVIGEHTIEVTDEGLLETTDYNTSLHRWSGFHKMKRSSGFLWIYATETMAHIVPLERPLLEGDLSVFVDQVRSKSSDAQAAPNIERPTQAGTQANENLKPPTLH